MKKIIFSLIAAFIAVFSMNAQTVSTVNYGSSSKFFDNWSVGVNGGVQANLHDWNAPQGAVAGITLDKQFTSVFGVTLEGGVGFNNTANWSGFAGDRRHMELSHGGTAIENLYAMADLRANLVNAIWGYKGTPRFFEVEAVGGVGYGHLYAPADRDLENFDDALLVKTGLNFNFNLGEKRAWAIRVSPAVVWDVTARSQFNSNLAVAQLTAGVVYHFKTSNGTHHIAKAHLYDQAEIDALNAKIAELQNRPAVVKEVVKEVPVETAVATSKWVVTFPFDSAELTDAAKIELDKVDTSVTVDVDTYASYEPKSSKEYNKSLTDRRLAAVKSYLESRGVKIADATSHGVDDAYGRVAIVTVK